MAVRLVALPEGAVVARMERVAPYGVFAGKIVHRVTAGLNCRLPKSLGAALLN